MVLLNYLKKILIGLFDASFIGEKMGSLEGAKNFGAKNVGGKGEKIYKTVSEMDFGGLKKGGDGCESKKIRGMCVFFLRV
jgi:hypothetical protein